MPVSPEFCIQTPQAHLWRASDADIPSALDSQYALLNTEERRRAQSLARDSDRRTFVFARGLLRTLLERYTTIPARSIRFEYGPTGKPFLVDHGASAQPIHFNLAHTRGRCLFAFASFPVGVDIEAINPNHDWSLIADHCFHPDEQRHLRSLPAPEKTKRSYTLWTCKEAILKTSGKGLGEGLNTLAIVILPNGEARLSNESAAMLQTACVMILNEGPSFAAAIASSGRPTHLCVHNATALHRPISHCSPNSRSEW
jgi:4'-phosphopantetheinyl transferase